MSAFLVVVAVTFLTTPASAQSRQASGATLVGRVLDANEAPVADATVRVEGTTLTALSDTTGRYIIVAVPAGPQTLRTERLGYATVRTPVNVPASGTLRVDVHIATHALEVEGLTVTADASGHAKGEVETATVIGNEAVRHQTATSLAGVLQLVPGVQMTPPSMGSVQQLTLRAVPTSGTTGGTSAAQLAAFGTLIILDGVPLSNNANLQSLGTNPDVSFSTSAGGGVDLRQIPASTIQRVEVIRGVPSARYGDLTQGAVIVDTRAGAFAPEARLQYDALTTEATAQGGWDIGRGRTMTANLDYARTRSNPGVTQDASNRVAGEVRYALGSSAGGAEEQGNGFGLDSRVDFYRLVDNEPTNPNTRPNNGSLSRDMGIRLSGRAHWAPSWGTLTATASVTRQWQHSFATANLVRGAAPFTDMLTQGTAQGFFVSGPYTSDLTVDGAPWLVYGRLEAEATPGWLGLRHDVRAGFEFRRTWNNGAGYQFDISRPPQTTFNGVQGYDRPRSFKSIPGMATTGFYLDDRVRGAFGRSVPWQIQLGARADILHKNGSWLPEPRDVVVEPRTSAEISLRPWLRLKGGWGITAKSPSLADLYPAPQYNDVVNVNWYSNVPAERLAVLTTYVFDPTNSKLGFSTAHHMDAGFEIGGGSSVVSVSAFQDRIIGGVGPSQEVTSVLRSHYQLTDSITGNGIPPQIIEPPSSTDTVPVLVQPPANHLTLNDKGVEITATFPEIPRIHTQIQLEGSFVRTDYVWNGLNVGNIQRFSDFQLSQVQQRAPYWMGTEEKGEQQLITYRVIHHQPALGLVVTATIQQNLKDFVDDPGSRDTLSWAGYITRGGQLVPVPTSDRALPQYQDLRLPRGGLVAPQATPSDWMMGLQVSKDLPLDGELRFWAFNALDRIGRYGTGTQQPRLYPRVQFGAELNLRPGAIWGGLR